jgi:hypothetical protein
MGFTGGSERMSQDDRKPARSDGPSPEAAPRPALDRYEPPRILKKRAVARIAQQFSGGGPEGGPPILVGDG